MKKYFGEYIKELRTEKGLTLTQLGAKLNLDSANLSKIENGKREFDEKRLTQLAEVFNLDLQELKQSFLAIYSQKNFMQVVLQRTHLFLQRKKLNIFVKLTLNRKPSNLKYAKQHK